MRDRGFDFEWTDRYAKNLFAKHFEQSKEHYDVVTAFELLEHLPNPMEDLSRLMALGDTVICSTELLREPAPRISDWWYYGALHGQHIAFYTEASMKKIAERFQRFYCGTRSIHIFSKERIPEWRLRLSVRHSNLINRLIRRPGLLGKDYERITGKRLD